MEGSMRMGFGDGAGSAGLVGAAVVWVVLTVGGGGLIVWIPATIGVLGNFIFIHWQVHLQRTRNEFGSDRALLLACLFPFAAMVSVPLALWVHRCSIFMVACG
jgi:hypothetical protein